MATIGRIERELRKQAARYKVNRETMQRFRSGALDVELEMLTIEHGIGRYYDYKGNAVD